MLSMLFQQYAGFLEVGGCGGKSIWGQIYFESAREGGVSAGGLLKGVR
jgi:hypothetical protein